jgi:hypothetical protein
MKNIYNENMKLIKERKIEPLNVDIKETTKTQYIKTILKNHLLLTVYTHRDIKLRLNNIFNKIINEDEIYFCKKNFGYINVVHFLKKMQELYPNKNTLKANLIPYVNLLGVMKQYIKRYENIYQLLSRTLIDINKDYEKVRDDNYVSDEDKNKYITDFTYDTIQKNLNKLDDDFDKVIYSLYMMIPARRLEYANVYLNSKTKKIKDYEKNYLYYENFPYNTTIFVFNEYKTSRNMGQQTINIPTKLKVILNNYIKKYKLKNGDKLLDVSENYLSKHIKRVFSLIYDEDVNLNIIRKSWATHINNMEISNNEKKELTNQMAHSYEQSQKYKKLL